MPFTLELSRSLHWLTNQATNQSKLFKNTLQFGKCMNKRRVKICLECLMFVYVETWNYFSILGSHPMMSLT